MQKYDIEYCTYDWGRLISVMNNLLRDGYVCRIATEEKLYLLDAIQSYDCDYAYYDGTTHCYGANRNETIFTRKNTFEENYDEIEENCDEINEGEKEKESE